MKPRRPRQPSLLAAVAVILGCLAVLAALVARDMRFRDWLRENECRPLPMQESDTTAGQARGTVCWACSNERTVCR